MDTMPNSFKSTMAALAMLVLVACTSATPATPTPTETHEDVIVRELAAKYQAIILWQEDMTYTLQAQERLIAGKPTLFTGPVDDVFHRDGKIFIRFSSSSGWSSFVFELECSPSMVNTILKGNLFDDYVVVADIQQVSRPVIEVRASPLSEDEAEIEMSTSGTTFIARGTCIDIRYIGAD